MTLSEFKAWFEGFTESMDGPPGIKAWERIQARVKEITGNPITERIYIDRYRDYLLNDPFPLRGYPYRYGTFSSAGTCAGAVGNAVAMNASGATVPLTYDGALNVFDGHTAMSVLGRSEAASMECAA